MSPSPLNMSDPVLPRVATLPPGRRARWIGLTGVLAVLALSAPVAQGQDVFASRGASAAAAVEQDLERQPEAYRQRAEGCRPILNQALAVENEMNAMLPQSNTREFQIDNRKRADLLKQYGVCVTNQHGGPPEGARAPAAGERTPTPGAGKPDFVQLKATLNQLDELIGRAANYQPPLTNKFLVTLAKDLRRDLTFLAQRPYVRAAQIARSYTPAYGAI